MKEARRTFVAVMGTWMGLAGIEHGAGELLQSPGVPTGWMIQSWPDSAFFRVFNGEPALTILPDMRLTGILAAGFSLLFILWAIRFAPRPNGGLMMILLCLPMLLFGAGIFPPILGALIGLAAAGLNRPVSSAPLTGFSRGLARAWPWIFAGCCAAWLALLPGIAALDYFFGVDQVGLTLAIIAAAFIFLPLSYWSAAQRDRQENLA